jgi:hypothetical protein
MRAPSTRRLLLTALLGFYAAAPCVAQSSASYKLNGTSFNNGGDPKNGLTLMSSHFHVTLDAIGDGLVRAALSSASFHADAGFVDVYRPVGEVSGLRFTNATTLLWNPDPAGARYEVYRGAISSLPGTFGTCFATGPMANATDASIPAAGTGLFYLVTARNLLGEEGPKGKTSNGTVRGNPTPCP